MNDAPASPNAPTPAPQYILQPRESLFGRFGKLLLVVLVFCIISMMGMASQMQEYFGDGRGPRERFHSLSRTATNKIAVVHVSGAIMEGDDFVEKQFEAIEKDDSVKAVVLRIDSPGGTVTYSDRLFHQAKKLREERDLPMVVSMGSLCASGGYYLAMAVGDQENAIYAEPTTWTGSIGVVIPNYNFSRTMNMYGAQDLSVVSGELKLMGSPTKPRTEEETEVLQELVDITFEGFKDVVREGRPKFAADDEALDAVATGQVFTAKQAIDNGLVDSIGFLEAAIDRAMQLANLSPTTARAVEYEARRTPIEQFLNASAPEQPATNGVDLRALDLQTLVELSSPRAYFLSTMAPVLLRSN
ncbi:signal peptide peptidase SppA [Botrimarina mediterranea]|uniref:Signal peptide peptidase SppA n=1 Tax=Botrimarina mediterranea TaxID=2528022 RepID=A0A518KEG8_9BACT|nr:signal peptide peptidase SppA [Botrimarina mediterranea]QDV76192.1 Putative signal peptide peptidase SppA [Botrimarina mediterranea]QDV80789.1 Putative signal peptide peptidase SppA [Planctomycetes bacterium K2D]